MGTKRVFRRGLCAVVAVTTVVGVGCTGDSDFDSAPTTASTTIPDDQKPPELRDPWNRTDLERLAEIDVPSYENEENTVDGTVLIRAFVSDPDPDDVTLTAKVRLAPCNPDSCWDITQEPDEERLAELRSHLAAVHRSSPDLVYEYGPDELIGDFEAFTVYWRSFIPDEPNHAIGYYVLYHDGLNRIEIEVTPSEAPDPADDETLEAQMSRDWAREVTTDVFAAFADEFNADG